MGVVTVVRYRYPAAWANEVRGMAKTMYLILLLLASATNAQYLRPDSLPLLQVYPDPDENATDDRKPIYLALLQSFGGSYTSAGVIPGIQVALDEINANSSILRDYRVHYYLTDTQV